MLQLFTDTDTDITPEVCKEYGYELISMPFSINQEEFYPYQNYNEFDPKKYYDMLRGGVMPSTSCISLPQYIDYFEPVFARGDDILYVHFSAAMSTTFNVMKMALDELKEKYPERKFYEIDTMGISVNALYTVLEVGDMVKAGKSVEEILEIEKEEVFHAATYFVADDLKFFGRSGRVSGITAAMGNLLGVRPIIHMNDEGKMVSCGKERGRQKALAKIVETMEELGDDIKGHRVIIGNSDAVELLPVVTDLIHKKFGDDINLLVIPVNPTAGAHCGPDALGIAFHAKHR